MIESARRAVRRLFRWWRGSLTVRVLTISLSASIVVAVAVSMLALTQVRDGLVSHRVDWALAESSDGLQTAVRLASSIPEPLTQGDRVALVEAVVSAVASPAGASGDYEVLLLASPNTTLFAAPERSTGQVSAASITNDLRSLVESRRAQAWQIAEISYLDGTRASGVIVGSPLYLPGIGDFQLFQLFPLSQEVATLELARSAIGLAGVLMAVSLLGVALLVTRQVVRPVRRVAESAERLRAGRLTERLPVRGQDDLARLATSFNSMAASMQEQIRRLEQLSRVQQRFVSDVSHELRTPLTTIRMGAELLHSASADFDPASRRATELLREQSERFEYLLNDLLEISRYDAGTVKLDTAEVDLGSVVRRVIQSLEPAAIAHSVKVDLFMPEPIGKVDCDVRRVERIIRNLVSNAIEHGERQPVMVCLASDEDALALCVRDWGAGLNPGEAALVFNRFWRADPSRQRTLGGNGLGLAISLEDARLHGGWLEADGAPGAGSNFRLLLPRVVGGEIGTPALPLAIEDIDAWLGQLT